VIRRVREWLAPPEERSYTDGVLELLLEQASATVSGITAAEEIAAGLLGRAFATASIDGEDQPLFPPDVMMTIARDLMSRGESVWRVGTRGRPLNWVPSYSFNGNGGYLIDGASVGGVNVLHARYAVDRISGRGVSPINCSPRFRKLLRQTEVTVEYETRGSVGYLVPTPAEGEDLTNLTAKIKELKGRGMLVETMAGGWGDRGNAPLGDYDQKRVGPMVPAEMQQLYQDTQRAALAVYGVPVPIVFPTDAASMREGWRIFLHSTIEPLARIVVAAARNAGLLIEINFDRLMASDVTGRARAFNSLVSGGMDVEEAATISGLLEAEPE